MVLRFNQLPLETLGPDTILQVAIGTHEKHKLFNPTGYWGFNGGRLELVLPNSVAEFYRQEGRRQLQSDFRDMISAARR